MTSRDTILAEIRTATATGPAHASARRVAAERRLEDPPQHLVPAIARVATAELPGRFAAALIAHGASVIDVASLQDLPQAIASFLDGSESDRALAAGSEPLFAGLPWAAAQISLLPVTRPLAGTAALSRALAGVAETGTLVLASGADNPTSLAFLPETHIVALARGDIVGSYEEAFECVRRLLGRHRMPRSLNLISGPSRTGDIGGRIVTGAHGPRRLAVVLYDSH